MDLQNGGLTNFRHRRSPSSDRFLDVFSPSKQGGSLSHSYQDSTAGDELNEDDVFWTGDFTDFHPPPPTSPLSQNSPRQPFRQSEKFGILAALPEDRRNPNHPLLYRKHLLSPSSPSSFQNFHGSSSGSPSASISSRSIRSIPKPQNYNSYSQSMPVRKFQQSAPMNVPMKPRNSLLGDVDVNDDDGDDDEMLPPHEIVARGSARSPKTTFSVLEGVGRTLKGRDLRRVRNAVWRQTGFLD